MEIHSVELPPRSRPGESRDPLFRTPSRLRGGSRLSPGHDDIWCGWLIAADQPSNYNAHFWNRLIGRRRELRIEKQVCIHSLLTESGTRMAHALHLLSGRIR